MLVPGFVVLAALTLSTPAPYSAATRRPAAAAASPPREAEPLPPPDARNLYSARARRRFASYLRLRLLEMREEGLVRAADVVRRRLPVDTLLEP